MCEAAVEKVAGRLEGVVAVDADYRAGTAMVTYVPVQITPAQIVEAINTQTFYRASLPGTDSAGVVRRESLWPGWPIYLVVAGGAAFLAVTWRRRRSLPAIDDV